MRRSRFAESITNDSSSRATWRDALLFDLRTPSDHDEFTVAQQRVTLLRDSPLLLASAHGVATILLFIHCLLQGAHHSLLTAAIAALVVLVFDVACAVVAKMGLRVGLAPKSLTIALCALTATITIAWAVFGYVIGVVPTAGNSAIVPLVIAGGAVACAIATSLSPALTLASALSATLATAFLTRDAMLTAGVGMLGLVLASYSVASTRTMLATAYRRLKLDHDAHKSLQFVKEFENSGQGWFWETNSQGTLSYVSEQLADDFKCRPDDLLGRQFTDLLSVDNGEGSMRDERTLGFHLSARFPFSDVVIRAATNEDIHWSLSGNPIFDASGRFMGFRGIGTDLTEQRRSEQEISRLARFNSLTSLPNRPMMRQTLEEALRNASSRQKGCALFLIDLDRFKNVNDTLGPSDRRCLASPGRRTAQIGHGQSWPGRASGWRRIQGGASRHSRNRPARIARQNTYRASVATLHDRRQQGYDRSIRRNCNRRPWPKLCRRADPQRRSGALRRQGRRSRTTLLLRTVDAFRSDRSAGVGKRSSPRARPQRIVGGISADRPDRWRRGLRFRSTGSLEPSDAWLDRSRPSSSRSPKNAG